LRASPDRVRPSPDRAPCPFRRAYLGFVAGPPIIGSVAEAIGLPTALVLLVALAVVVAALARSARPLAAHAAS
jgi:hypothetical protein